jgi:TP53 regulating kinase-like protein
MEQLLAQGAEARIFASNFLGRPTIIKERFKKAYRHPQLDEKLTRERVASVRPMF